jgi:hypothetical protein
MRLFLFVKHMFTKTRSVSVLPTTVCHCRRLILVPHQKQKTKKRFERDEKKMKIADKEFG